jgi:DNA-binding XRE family transcriptional regulator
VKELRVVVRARNNRLRERRLEAGLTQRELAEEIGVSYQVYGCLENMSASPLDAEGRWRPGARQVARHYGLPLEELFPEGVRAVRQATVSRKVDVSELGPLLADPRAGRVLLPPGVRARNICRQVAEAVDGTVVGDEKDRRAT